MRGTINSIWLTGDEGLLHSQIIGNLSQVITVAAEEGFEVVLWSNLTHLKKSEVKKLEDLNIQVKDYSECHSSIFFSNFMYFLQKGIDGDKTAFALASDILRMSILELAPYNQYFIYHDPNDIKFHDLKQSLKDLDKLMLHNSFGFSFPINPLLDNFRIFETRNDLLIAKKANNYQFFKDFFINYKNHLEKQSVDYKKPDTTDEAQELARKISSQLGFFSILLTDPIPIIKTSFGKYSERFPLIDCLFYFPYERQIEHANTWLPTNDFTKEIEQMKKDFSFFQKKLPGKYRPKSLSAPVSEDIKDCILRDYGHPDGSSLIEIIESLGAGNDLRLYKDGIEIPEHLISNKNQFQQDLSQLSVTGRSFPIENINGYIQINCMDLKPETTQNYLDEMKLLLENFSFFPSLIDEDLLKPSMLFDQPIIPGLD